MASGISYSVKIALVIAWVMAGDQKLKSHPDGLNFDDVVGNPGHSITHTTYWQKPPFFFFSPNTACHPQHLLAMLELKEKYPSIL